MSFNQIIETLDKLLRLQKSLMTLAVQKTEIVKKGDISALQVLLKDEQAHLRAIKSLEVTMLNTAKTIVGVPEPTLTDIIQTAEGENKERLERLQRDLEESVVTLSERNTLNQQLLEQSLHFINLSLDLLVPSIDSYNYDNQNQSNEYDQPNRSIFNSKV